MFEESNIKIMVDMDGNKIVLINDIRFKGKRNIVWEDVKIYLQRYVGKCYKIEESAEIIYIGNDLPEEFTESNRKKKHAKNAKNGWFRYDVRFALPAYENEVLVRYNIFHARLLVNHAANGRKYLYDILAIKKETSKPQQ